MTLFIVPAMYIIAERLRRPMRRHFGGKSLEQNIYLTFKFNNRINQTVIDIDKMIDFNLLNLAKNQLQKKKKFKALVLLTKASNLALNIESQPDGFK